LESWKLLLPHNKHLFVGSENRSALSMQFQLFAVARGDRFLGNGRRRARLSSVLMSVTAMLRQLSDAPDWYRCKIRRFPASFISGPGQIIRDPIQPTDIVTGWAHGVRRSVTCPNGVRVVLLRLNGERAESDVDCLRYLVTSDAHRERVFPRDQTIAGEDNPLVCSAYSDAVMFSDELRLL